MNGADSRRWLSPPRLWLAFLVLAILAGGTWIRFRSLAADPLDVAHSQQLQFLLIARAFHQPAPTSLTGMPTSLDYAATASDAPLLQWVDGTLAGLFPADLISVARAVSIIGWMLASLLVYLLIRGKTQPIAAIAILVMMIFLPFSIQFSRAVLPGSWAMFFAILSLGLLWRWLQRPIWRTAFCAALLGSMAVLLQAEWLLILLGGLVAAWRLSRKGQPATVWQILSMAALLLIPRLVFALWQQAASPLTAFLGLESFSLGVSTLKLVSRLELRVENIIGILGIGFGVLGVILTPKGPRRSLLVGLWAGFALMCLLSLKAISESIYLLYPLILLSSLSFISIFEWLLETIAENSLGAVNTVMLVALLVVAAGLGSLDGRRLVKANPEQIPVDFWRGVGQRLGPDTIFLSNSNTVTLPLAYYGGNTPACFTSSGDCLSRVDAIVDQNPGARIEFIFFKGDLDKVLSASPRLALSDVRCDLGSGVMMIPLTASDPACKGTGN